MRNEPTTQVIATLSGSNSILVISPKGIFRLYCPFEVKCIEAIDVYSTGEVLTVVSVMSKDKKLVYIIKDKGYFHSCFMILSKSETTLTTFD